MRSDRCKLEYGAYRQSQAVSFIVEVSIKVPQVFVQRADVLVNMVINLMCQVNLLISYSENLQYREVPASFRLLQTLTQDFKSPRRDS